jgi:hypothetical protein
MAKTQSRTTKARTTRQKKTTHTPIPPMLAALLALIDESANTADADEMARALATARLALRDPLRARSFEPKDRVWDFIVSEAKAGVWNHLHAAIDKLERPEDSIFKATAGDFQNLYGGPAFAMGIAFCYAFLEGAR